MKQKVFGILMAIVMLVVPCGLFASGASEGSKGSEQIVLDFPTWQAEEGGFALFWKDMVAQFEETHPNVKINLTQIPFSQFTDTLITRYSANDAPDITHIASRFFDQFASQGWFEDLDPYLAKDNTLDDWTALQSAMLHDGKNEGLLILGYGFVMYYNEEILNRAGVAVPTTVDELKEAIVKIEALNDPDIYPYGVTTQQHSNAFQDFSIFLVGEGTSIEKDGKCNLTSEAVVKAASDYNYVASKSPKGVSTEMLRQLFIDGKVAMIIDGPFVAPLISSADEDIRPNLKIARAPFEYVPGTISNSLHISNSLSEERKQLVWEFIEQCASLENQVKYSEYTESPCGRLSASSMISDPGMAFVNNIGAEAVSIMPQSSNLTKNYSKYTNIVITYVLKLQEAGADVKKVLADMESELMRNNLEP